MNFWTVAFVVFTVSSIRVGVVPVVIGWILIDPVHVVVRIFAAIISVIVATVGPSGEVL